MIEYDSRKFWRLVFQLRGSVIPRIALRMLLVTLVAVGMTLVHFYWRPIKFSSTPFSIVGVALGLLLVFRTNASYDRFWEGRKLWGRVVNAARNYGIGVNSYIHSGGEASALKTRSIDGTVAFCRLMMQHLRSEYDANAVGHLVDKDLLQQLNEADHKPVRMMSELAKWLEQARVEKRISDVQAAELNKELTELIGCLGGCERILKTPLPLAYVLHLKRFMVLFCLVLPAGLVFDLGWWTIPSIFFITYSFFGIEEIGIEIEDPFGRDPNDLPLDGLCDTIEKNLKEFRQV